MKSRFQILSAILLFALIITPSFGTDGDPDPKPPAPSPPDFDPEVWQQVDDPNAGANLPEISPEKINEEGLADPIGVKTGSFGIREPWFSFNHDGVDYRVGLGASPISGIPWTPKISGVAIIIDMGYTYLPVEPILGEPILYNVMIQGDLDIWFCWHAIKNIEWSIPSEALVWDTWDCNDCIIPDYEPCTIYAKMLLPPGGPYTVALDINDHYKRWGGGDPPPCWDEYRCQVSSSERNTHFDWDVYGSWLASYNGVNWFCPWIIELIQTEDDPCAVYLNDGTGRLAKFRSKEGSDNEFCPPAGRYETLIKNQDGTFTLIDKHGTKKKLGTDGLITEIEDRNGNKVIYTYSDTGSMKLIDKITDDLGRDTNFTCNTKGLLTNVTDPAQRTWTYSYDADSSDLLSTEAPMGLTKSYTYLHKNDKSTSLIETQVDPNGDTYLTNYYDSNNMVWKQKFGAHDYLFAYHPDVNMTTFTNRSGYDSNIIYNQSGQALKEFVYTEELRESDPNYYLTQHSYDANGEITKKVFPAGNWIDYEYDSKGNITKVVKEPNNGEPNIIMSFTYEPNFSFITSANDALGNVYTLDYNDANGNLEKITFPEVAVYGQGNVSPTITATYNQYGQIKTVTLPDGIVYKCEYYSRQDNSDPNCGRIHKVIYDYSATDGNALKLTYEYKWNMYNKVIEVNDPNGDITQYDYNPLEKITSFTNALEQVVRLGYNNNMMMTKIEREVTDDSNQVTEFGYNILDKLTRITDPLGNITRLDYDPEDNLSDVNDAEENNTHYDYDERDLLWKITDANGNLTQFSYTLNGKLAEVNDARGNVTKYTYDGFDRLVQITYPDDTNEKYGYDKNSNVTSFTNRAGEKARDAIHYQYDALGQMTVKNRPGEPNIYFKYDIMGRLMEVNDHRPVTEGGGVTSYKYDRLGRVTEVNDIEGRVIEYEYDELGRRKKLVYPYLNGRATTYEYDKLSRLTKVTHGMGGAVTARYKYDQLGRRTLTTLGNDSNAVYDYDIADRLTKITNNINVSDSIIFRYDDYDKVGNRLSCKIDSADPQVYTYDKLYQLTKVVYYDVRGVMCYNYDELGNRVDANENGTVTSYTTNSLNQYTSIGGTAYSYDDNGNLTNDGFYKYYYDGENRLTDVNYVNNSRVASYKYDWLGRRVRKIVYGSPDVVTSYCYDGDQVIEEYDRDGTFQRKFVYGIGIDESIAMFVAGEGWYYYHYDGLGSVVALSDRYGNIIEECSYNVFGEPSCISGVGNPYKFTGRRYDAETELYYYRERYYMPEIGRFLQPDPIGYIGGLNLYKYVDNNPIYWKDPWGLCPVTDPEKQKILDEIYNEREQMMQIEQEFYKKYPPYDLEDHMEDLQSPDMLFKVPMDIKDFIGDLIGGSEESLARRELERKQREHAKRMEELIRQLYPKEKHYPPVQVPEPNYPADPKNVGALLRIRMGI